MSNCRQVYFETDQMVKKDFKTVWVSGVCGHACVHMYIFVYVGRSDLLRTRYLMSDNLEGDLC